MNDNFRCKDEAYVARCLNGLGLPEDLPEVTLAGGPAPPSEALERIRIKTMQQIGVSAVKTAVKTKRQRLNWVKGAAAIILLGALAALLYLGPSRAWAGLQKIIGLVPGIGVFEEDPSYLLVAGKTVKIDDGNGTIEIIGLAANQSGTHVKISLRNASRFVEPSDDDVNPFIEVCQGMYMLDAEGRMYPFREVGGGQMQFRERGLWADMGILFSPLDLDTSVITLVIPYPDGSESRLNIPLVSAADSGLADTISREGMSVSAAIHYSMTETWVFIGVQPSEAFAAALFIQPMYSNFIGLIQANKHFRGSLPDYYVELSGMDDIYDFQWNYGYGDHNYINAAYEKLRPEEEAVTLSIPALLFIERGRVRISVRIPEKGDHKLVETVTIDETGDTVEAISYPGSAVQLDHKLSLGRFPLTLKAAEVITYPKGDYLRIHMESQGKGKEKLLDFRVSHVHVVPRNRRKNSYNLSHFKLFTYDSVNRHYQALEVPPYINSYCSLTGHLEYIELPLKESTGLIRIELQSPVYIVEGPWIFNFPVPE